MKFSGPKITKFFSSSILNPLVLSFIASERTSSRFHLIGTHQLLVSLDRNGVVGSAQTNEIEFVCVQTTKPKTGAFRCKEIKTWRVQGQS